MFRSARGASSVLDKVRTLVPEIIEERRSIEANRGLSAGLNRRLIEAGVFRMMIPRRLGGEELDLLQISRVVEELSRADAAAGWTAMVANGFNVALGHFPQHVVDLVLADGPDVLIRGALAPKGKLVPVEGGYRISGQWPLASGSYAYKWVAANGIVFEGERPRIGPDGRPDMRMVIMPAADAKFLDTWKSVGLRGSASHDFVLDNVFVSEDRTGVLFGPSVMDGPLHRLFFPMLTASQHSAVCIGIALGALGDLGKIALVKRPTMRPDVKLAEDSVFQHRFGELMARLDAARGFADWHTEELAEFALSGQPVTLADMSRSQAMVASVSLACVDIVNDAFTLAGSTAAYDSAYLQQRWRDVRVASQHYAASTDAYHAIGKWALGDMQARTSAAKGVAT